MHNGFLNLGYYRTFLFALVTDRYYGFQCIFFISSKNGEISRRMKQVLGSVVADMTRKLLKKGFFSKFGGKTFF